MDTMFDKLLQLPLFQGLSHEDFQCLIESYPFHFLKYAAGDQIIAAGDACTHVRFIVGGSVQFATSCRNLKVSVEHTLDSPDVIAPDYLFGLATAYPFDAWALGETSILQIKKLDYLSMLSQSNVLTINILNYLSRNSQAIRHQLLETQNQRVAERLAIVATLFTAQRSHDIKIKFRQRDLNRLLGVNASRVALADACNTFMEQGLITSVTQGEIVFGDRQALVRFING